MHKHNLSEVYGDNSSFWENFSLTTLPFFSAFSLVIYFLIIIQSIWQYLKRITFIETFVKRLASEKKSSMPRNPVCWCNIFTVFLSQETLLVDTG